MRIVMSGSNTRLGYKSLTNANFGCCSTPITFFWIAFAIVFQHCLKMELEMANRQRQRWIDINWLQNCLWNENLIQQREKTETERDRWNRHTSLVMKNEWIEQNCFFFWYRPICNSISFIFFTKRSNIHR